MNKKERILKRQMALFQFVKGWNSVDGYLSNDLILNNMSDHYSTVKTVKRDLNTLEQKFLIVRNLVWTKGVSKSIRNIGIVNKTKELLSQCNYDYLEALALANPHCFLIKWREGYDHKEGGIQKFLDAPRGKTIGAKKWGTGVYLLKEPSNLLSTKPLHIEENEVGLEDPKSYNDPRPCLLDPNENGEYQRLTNDMYSEMSNREVQSG